MKGDGSRCNDDHGHPIALQIRRSNGHCRVSTHKTAWCIEEERGDDFELDYATHTGASDNLDDISISAWTVTAAGPHHGDELEGQRSSIGDCIAFAGIFQSAAIPLGIPVASVRDTDDAAVDDDKRVVDIDVLDGKTRANYSAKTRERPR